MNNLFQTYHKPILFGGMITLALVIMFNRVGLFLVNPQLASSPVHHFVNALSFVVLWFIISVSIHKFSIYKVLGVLSLLVGAAVGDMLMRSPVNPITIPLMILFWLGVVYLIVPEFFNKYKIAILSVYGAVLSYFFIFRMMPNYVEEHHQNFLNFMLIPVPVFAVLWGYEQWRWLRTLQAEKTKTELALLKSHINPHFFFNTLNNLYGLVVEKSEQAPEVVLKLSDMMRYTIYDGKEDLVPLQDEIQYLDNYIELHKIRYQKKVDISFTHDVQQGLTVAPLLFIILLENAFKHGVENMREHAFIHLQMTAHDKQLLFSIENSIEESSSHHHKGIGLDNLKKRLDYLYPNRHQLIVEETESSYTVQLRLEFL